MHSEAWTSQTTGAIAKTKVNLAYASQFKEENPRFRLLHACSEQNLPLRPGDSQFTNPTENSTQKKQTITENLLPLTGFAPSK